MADIKLNARLIQLHDTEANWDRVSDKFIPNKSEAVLFDPDKNHPYVRIKYGNGETPLKDLPFNHTEEINNLFNEKDGVLYFDAGEISNYPQKGDN